MGIFLRMLKTFQSPKDQCDEYFLELNGGQSEIKLEKCDRTVAGQLTRSYEPNIFKPALFWSEQKVTQEVAVVEALTHP